MTHLERFKNSIARKHFDRVPIDISMTPEMTRKMLGFMGTDEQTLVYKLFDIDRRGLWARYAGPELRKFEDGTYENMFGVRMKDMDYGAGVYSEAIGFPLVNTATVAEIDAYNWPAADWYDYSHLNRAFENFPDYPFTVGYLALGWHSWEMRGMSRFMEDLLLETELAEAIIRKISDFGFEYFRCVIEAGRPYIGKNFVCIHIADDWATQNGLLISPALFRRFFKEHYRRIIDMAHNAGLLVEFHCCGSAVGLIHEFIDLGVDILNPVQTSANGMEPSALKREFGKDIAFSGGIDVQTVLPFGTPETVSREVYYLLDTMGKDGGYILEPSHSIQTGTPPMNVLAMYRAVYDYYGMQRDF